VEFTIYLLLDFSLVSVGYKIRVDSSMFGANQRIVAQEIDRKKKEYRDNEELTEISQKYQMKQVATL